MLREFIYFLKGGFMIFFKLFHVFFLFVWIGTLLNLTYLLSFHNKESTALQSSLARIYRRIYFRLDLPAMILALGSGIAAICLKDMDWKAPWIHMKLTFVALLIGCDIIAGWRIVKLGSAPIQGKGVGYKILYVATLLILLGILAAIYILKK